MAEPLTYTAGAGRELNSELHLLKKNVYPGRTGPLSIRKIMETHFEVIIKNLAKFYLTIKIQHICLFENTPRFTH